MLVTTKQEIIKCDQRLFVQVGSILVVMTVVPDPLLTWLSLGVDQFDDGRPLWNLFPRSRL